MAASTWHLVVCGISHKTSSLKEHEPLQLGHNEMAKANDTFRNLPGVMESTVMATCNRVEFYFVAEKRYQPFQIVASFYDILKRIDISPLEGNFYTRRDKHAADHLFRVTAGLDSMVLGENQILGQVKDAYSSACAVKAVGKVIHRLFHQAFRVGKEVRTDTEMGKGACSISSASVELLRTRIDELDKPTILFVGINQMIALAAGGLNRLDSGSFLFANRTVEKAVAFATKYGATGHSLEELPSLLGRADVVVTCTGSNLPIITRDMLDGIVVACPEKKLTIMDMAVPRDVEIEKDYSANVTLFDLEDLKSFVKDRQKKRELAIPQSEEIVERKLDEFMYWFDHVRHEPAYNGLDGSFEAIRQEEIEPLMQKLAPEVQKEIDRATRRLVDRLLQVKIRTTTPSEKLE